MRPSCRPALRPGGSSPRYWSLKDERLGPPKQPQPRRGRVVPRSLALAVTQMPTAPEWMPAPFGCNAAAAAATEREGVQTCAWHWWASKAPREKRDTSERGRRSCTCPHARTSGLAEAGPRVLTDQDCLGLRGCSTPRSGILRGSDRVSVPSCTHGPKDKGGQAPGTRPSPPPHPHWGA